MDWIHATDAEIATEPDDTSFAGSPPHAVFIQGDAGAVTLLGVEGTADELRELAQRFTEAVAGLS